MLVGHGSPAMPQHYTHIALETAQKAVATLPDVTHAEALPEPPNATESEMAEVEKVLERMTLAQLQGVAVKVQCPIGKLGHKATAVVTRCVMAKAHGKSLNKRVDTVALRGYFYRRYSLGSPTGRLARCMPT